MMADQIKKIVVLGAGVMGGGIAAHLAGCGAKVLLLDCLPNQEKDADIGNPLLWRNKFALSAIERIKFSKPSLIYSADDISNIEPGNFEDDLNKLSDADWIIEAVLERVDIKQSLYKKIIPFIKSNAIISSNTSGIAWELLTKDMPLDFCKRFIITHFFNPPRYMKLVEVVSGRYTIPDFTKTILEFCEQNLGKGVIFAKDTPNFIANRIGVMHIMDVMHLILEKEWPIEAVDTVLGTPVGRPKSAIFRTADIVGLDTLLFVADTLAKRCTNDEMIDMARIPSYLMQMIAKNWTGQKAGQGFYKKDKETNQILAINPKTLDYKPSIKFRTPSLGRAKDIRDVKERINTVVWADDHSGEIAWEAISRMLAYSARRVPEISDDIVNVDKAMRWGFNWKLGPFETWDALGVEKICERLSKQGAEIPPIVKELLSSNENSFYKQDNNKRLYFDIISKKCLIEKGRDEILSLDNFRKQNLVIAKNSGASIIYIGDGVYCCEFHTKMNSIDADVISMIDKGIDLAEKDGVGLLIANQDEHFSVGANLLLVLMAAEEKRWSELEDFIKEFQRIAQRIRFSKKPVVSAPFSMTLGGGFEICLASAKKQAAAESYMGLVETGVGLIPAGGGCKNLILQMESILKETNSNERGFWCSPDDMGPFPKVQLAFERIAMATVSASAKDAQKLGLLTPHDSITLDNEKLIYEAKQDVIDLEKTYKTPVVREDITLPGNSGKQALINAINGYMDLGKITEHDAVIGNKLAHVLTGGDIEVAHKTNEQHILDLEREVFVSLCGMEKTRERMKYMLLNGKPLRN